VRDLRRGGNDEHLVYRKALRKGLDEYHGDHAAACQGGAAGGGAGGQLSSTSMTARAAAARATTAPTGLRHYVEKQRGSPDREQVFPHLGLSFDEAVGEARQMRLF